MRVNEQIRKTLNEISDQSIKYANEEDKERKYLKRLIHIFEKHLDENEKIFILRYILDFIHYKNITIDPENIIMMNNIKLRHYFLVLFLVFGFIIITGIVLFQSGALLNFLETITKFLKFLNAI